MRGRCVGAYGGILVGHVVSIQLMLKWIFCEFVHTNGTRISLIRYMVYDKYTHIITKQNVLYKFYYRNTHVPVPPCPCTFTLTAGVCCI